jgi:hypothetical protein
METGEGEQNTQNYKLIQKLVNKIKSPQRSLSKDRQEQLYH